MPPRQPRLHKRLGACTPFLSGKQPTRLLTHSYGLTSTELSWFLHFWSDAQNCPLGSHPSTLAPSRFPCFTKSQRYTGIGRHAASASIDRAGQFTGAPEHVEQHFFSQFASGGVLLAGVVARQQDWLAGRDAVFALVAKREGRAAGDNSSRFHDSEISIERNLAQGDHHLHAMQGIDLALQKRPAVAQLLGQRLVAGRRAACGGGDVRRMQRQAISARDAGWLRGEAGAVQHAVEPVARFIASEHTARTVRSMGAGGEAQNENARPGVAEARHRLAPIFPVEVGAALDGCDVRAVVAQTRAAAAGDNFGIEDFQQKDEPKLILNAKLKCSPACVELNSGVLNYTYWNLTNLRPLVQNWSVWQLRPDSAPAKIVSLVSPHPLALL
jgi:hypothetical protein